MDPSSKPLGHLMGFPIQLGGDLLQGPSEITRASSSQALSLAAASGSKIAIISRHCHGVNDHCRDCHFQLGFLWPISISIFSPFALLFQITIVLSFNQLDLKSHNIPPCTHVPKVAKWAHSTCSLGHQKSAECRWGSSSQRVRLGCRRWL